MTPRGGRAGGGGPGLDPCREVEPRILIASPDRDLRYYCRGLVKRKRALLGSNPPRNSRLETHSDGTGADRNWPAPATGRSRSHHLLQASGYISPSLKKPLTITRPGTMVAGLASGIAVA